MFKNESNQGVYVYAHDTDNDIAAVGIASDIIATLSKDGAAATALGDTHPVEITGGTYWFDFTKAETNADALVLVPDSTGTGSIAIDPLMIYPEIRDVDVTGWNGVVVTDYATKVDIDNVVVTGEANWSTADISNVNVTGWNGAAVVDYATSAELEAIVASGQSNWITAVGFSTHSAADIWTSATRTLTNMDVNVTGINGEPSDFTDTMDVNVTGWDSTAVVDYATSAELEEIVASGQLNWITATGFSTHAATDVWAATTRTLTNMDVNVTGIDGDSVNVPDTIDVNITGVQGATPDIATSTELEAVVASGQLYWTTATDINVTGWSGTAVVDYARRVDVDNIVTTGQANWLTATGFSTHDPSGVWNYATRTLTDGGSVCFDVNVTGWDGSTVTPYATKTDVDNVVTTGQANWLTAVGFSTHAASDVWISPTRTLTNGVNITGWDGTSVVDYATKTDINNVVATGESNWATATGTLTAEEVWTWASGIDGKTPQQAMQYMAAILAGIVSGAGTGTEVFKGLDGTTTRVTVTVDINGNRTNIALN